MNFQLAQASRREQKQANLGSTFNLILLLAAICLLIALAGCSSGSANASTSGVTQPAGKAASSIFIGNQAASGFLGFSATAGGSGSPSTMLNLPVGQVGVAGASAFDSTGQLYVAVVNDAGNTFQVLVYPANASGSVSPSRSISVPTYISSLAVDGAGSLYVGTYTVSGGDQYTGSYQGAINVYSPTASGDATPTRTIIGNGLQVAYDLAVDAAGDIYAIAWTKEAWIGYSGESSSLFIFASGANGTVTPERSISSTANGFAGVTILPNGNAAVSGFPITATSTSSNSIMEYSPTATGVATPATTINLGVSTNYGVGRLRADGAGDLYVLTSADTPTNPATVAGFAAGASGDATPFVSLTFADASVTLRPIALL